MIPTKIKSKLCQICGDINAKKNYDVLCCSPCKIFFRRNAQTKLNTDQCVFGGDCDITINSRGSCKHCRLKKCFSVGMQEELIRAKRSKSIEENNISSIPVIISTLDLLNNDRSLLKVEEWSVITYISNAYDEKSLISATRDTITAQSKQSIKMRLKMATSNYNHVTSECFTNVGKFMNEIPQYKTMSINDQSALVERNIYTMGGLGGVLILHEVNMCSHPYYYDTAINMYGSRIVEKTIDITRHAESDGLLLKLFLSILAFSTCTDVLEINGKNTNMNNLSSSNNRFFSNTKHLFEIQNIYIELLYKYMLFRFGHKETILRFFGLIKTCLDLSTMLEKNDDTGSFNQLVDTITKETEQSLILRDQSMEDYHSLFSKT